MYPPPLQELIDFFEHLPEGERRENLIDLAEAAASCTPQPGLDYEVAQVRKDPQCSDEVGVYVRRDAAGKVHFALKLGPKVQTLTRALAVILCRGLNGSLPQAIKEVPQDFVSRIIGADLVRLRSQTVYYVLDRMKEAAATLDSQA